MGRETDIGPISALDKQIAEKEAEIVQLKRLRNSLLTVGRIPPEILGYVFAISADLELPWTWDSRFAGIQKDPHNFLLVCHHWYEVANHTPEIWSSWGNNLGDWKRRYLRFENFPLDLVLQGNNPHELFDEAMRNALKNRAARDLIRKIHLNADPILTASIVSSLTPENEGARCSSVTSIKLTGVDVPNFFARHRFPKLRVLSLLECPGIPLDHLKSPFTITTLVDLALSIQYHTPSPTSIPTTSQILSLFASNPNLQDVILDFPLTEDDIGNGPRTQVPLRHLKDFFMTMDFHPAITILRQLEFSDGIDRVNLIFRGSTLETARQVIGPYIRDHLRGDARFGSKLVISSQSDAGHVFVSAGVLGVWRWHLDQLPTEDTPKVSFMMPLPEDTSGEDSDGLCTDILALLPRERIAYLQSGFQATVSEETLVASPNIEALRVHGFAMDDRFLLPNPDGPNANGNFLPSLQWLYLEDVEPEEGNWDPLVRYLTHQISGGQSISLVMSGEVHVPLGVRNEIEGLVERFLYHPLSDWNCSLGCCPDYI